MQVEVLADPEAVAQRAARELATAAREAIAARGRCVLAVSGGRTPWLMLRAVAQESLDWPRLDIVQVDERVAPAGDADRNLTHLLESLQLAPLRRDQIHAMPVEQSNLSDAAAEYAATLEQLAGLPPVLDVVHLGLGADGHTASLIPGDPVLEVTDAEVAVAGPYQGRHRLTLTYPLLDRARRILWVVTGSDKQAALARLLAGDGTIPAGRVRQDAAWLFADRAAAG